MRVTEWPLERPRLARGIVLLAALCVGVATVEIVRHFLENARREWLRTEVSRRAIELMGQTINGKVMGSMSVLGLVDPLAKEAAADSGSSATRTVEPILEAIGRSYSANGVFIVGTDGRITASWDIKGRSNTGLDVKFRSYFQMAMQGADNVYAAVSLATRERSIYFAAPIYADARNYSTPIGAAVARVDPSSVDWLLSDWGSPAVLLTPQGVAFAVNRPDWMYRLAGEATPERLRDIRAIRQFGAVFDKAALPESLPIDVDSETTAYGGARLAVVKVPVQWNDPMGDWTLVLTTDLDEAMPWRLRLEIGAATTVAVLILLWLVYGFQRSRLQRERTTQALRDNAEQMEAAAALRSTVAGISLRLQQAKDAADLARTFLAEAAEFLGMRQGAFYLAAADGGHLELAASYGCHGDDGTPVVLAFGEGLVGQCAVEKRKLVLADAPSGYLRIVSGLGDASPRAVVMAPILLNDVVLGVVELALLTPAGAHGQHVLDELLPILAMNVEIQRRNHGAGNDRS